MPKYLRQNRVMMYPFMRIVKNCSVLFAGIYAIGYFQRKKFMARAREQIEKNKQLEEEFSDNFDSLVYNLKDDSKMDIDSYKGNYLITHYTDFATFFQVPIIWNYFLTSSSQPKFNRP
jgi:hypothetical protein